MSGSPGRASMLAMLIVFLLGSGGCNKSKDEAPTMAAPPRTPITQLMFKVASGPESLTYLIGRELRTDPPAWDKIQAQAKEFVELAGTLGKYDPPRGSKESWAKFTSDYASNAATLERAAKAKDKTAAVAAQEVLKNACQECHKEHKGGPAGMRVSGGRRSPTGDALARADRTHE